MKPLVPDSPLQPTSQPIDETLHSAVKEPSSHSQSIDSSDIDLIPTHALRSISILCSASSLLTPLAQRSPGSAGIQAQHGTKHHDADAPRCSCRHKDPAHLTNQSCLVWTEPEVPC